MSSPEDALKEQECDHIRRNLSSLIRSTTLDPMTLAIFIERDILGSDDVDKLNSINSKHERNLEFYGIIQTRVGFYKVLLKAMKDTCQTGVLELLNKLNQGDNVQHGTSDQPRKYSCLPKGLHELMFPVHKPLCVFLNTPDVNVTFEKVSECLKVPHELHDSSESFRYHISLANPGKSNLHIVKVPDFEELKHILLDLRRTIFGKKLHVVLVTETRQEHNQSWFSDYARGNLYGGPLMKFTCDNLEWADLSPAYQQEIRSIFKNTSKVNLQGELNELLHGKVLAQLIHGKDIKLFKDTIPPQLGYYADRTIFTRNVISRDVFGIGKEEPHTFLFTGWEEPAQTRMSRSELFGLVKDSMTGCSREQLGQPRITVKFMVLDKSAHFERICERLSLEKPSESVHLLHFDSEKRLIWEKSHGELAGLHRFIDEPRQDRMSDEQFLQMLMQNSNIPVFISDSPGMGKSVLLGHMGWKLKELCPDRDVFFINIVEFIQQIKAQNADGMVTEELVVTSLQHLVCENALGRAILKLKLTPKEHVQSELLLDGFDELEEANYKLALDTLKVVITSLKSIRLWVTSRPHFLTDLANTLKVLGYKIKPFNNTDQVKFLARFWSWSQSQYKLNPDKLTTFAKTCLAKIKSGVNMSICQDIAGMLLQCHLIGELYGEEAAEYSEIGSKSALKGEFQVRSDVELFEKVIDKKMCQYEARNTEAKLERKVNMNCHARAALQLLFSEHFKALRTLLAGAGKKREEILRVGILEASSKSDVPRFIHMAFAEYYTAWFVVEQFKLKLAWLEKLKLTMKSRVAPKKVLLDFFLPDILKCEEIKIKLFGLSAKEIVSYKFLRNTIAYFINSLLMDKDTQDIAIRFQNYFRHSQTSQQRLTEIAHACANCDYLQIFKFLDAANAFDKYSSSIFNHELLILSVEFSSVEFVEIVLCHFDSHFESNDDLEEISIRALQTAVQRANFTMVEFFLKVRGLRKIVGMPEFPTKYRKVRLIHDCIASSNTHSGKEIEQRITTIETLIRINPSLLEETNIHCTPLLCPDIHFSIMELLIKLGAVICRTDNVCDTILHLSKLTGRRISTSDYDKLLVLIPDDCLKLLINQYGSDMDTPPVRVLKYHDPSEATLDKFNDLGFNFKTDKYSIIESAIKAGRSSATIRKLIDIGASVDWKNDHGQTLLHLAVESSNVDAINVLADHVDVNLRDEDGLTPLDKVLRSQHFTGRLEMGKALHAKDCVFTEVPNSHDQTLLHTAAVEGNLDSVRLLVDDMGEDVNVHDKKGNTPLHVGVWFDTVALLLESKGTFQY